MNVLVYAFRPDAPQHEPYARYLEDLINEDSAFGLADVVCSGFLRITTHPKIFTPPAFVEEALAFIEPIRAQPNCFILSPGERHWSIFTKLCEQVSAKGNLIPDAYLAALAIESGSEWITTDRDFARFPGLKWRHPLEGWEFKSPRG